MTPQPDAQASRPVRDCQHPRARHEHGTRAAYVLDRCRCPPCRRANTNWARRRSTAIVYGTWVGLVDADPARQHLQELRRAGLSVQRIGTLARVGHGTVNALLYGEPARHRTPSHRLRADTAARLLALRFDPAALPPGRQVDATGSRRRLQALAVLGWSLPALDRHTDLPVRTLRRALTAQHVTAGTADAIIGLYERLRTTGLPHRTRLEVAAAGRVAGQARAAGWRAPLGWHDIDTDPDEEAAVPASAGSRPALPTAATLGDGGEPDQDWPSPQAVDDVAVQRAMTGERLPLTAAERREAVTRLTGRGLSARRIAELLHTTSRTVTRLRSAARDLAA